MNTETKLINNLQEPLYLNRYEVFFSGEFGDAADAMANDLRLSCNSVFFDNRTLYLQFYDFVDNKVLIALDKYIDTVDLVKIKYYGADHSVIRTVLIKVPAGNFDKKRVDFTPLAWQATSELKSSTIHCELEATNYKIYDKDGNLIYCS